MLCLFPFPGMNIRCFNYVSVKRTTIFSFDFFVNFCFPVVFSLDEYKIQTRKWIKWKTEHVFYNVSQKNIRLHGLHCCFGR